MNRPRRGDVFVADLYGQEVPVVVVSRDSINGANPIVVIVPAVPKEQLEVIGYGHMVVVSKGTLDIGGEWVFLCANVRSLRLDQLTAPAGTLPPRLMAKIGDVLRTVLDLN